MSANKCISNNKNVKVINMYRLLRGVALFSRGNELKSVVYRVKARSYNARMKEVKDLIEHGYKLDSVVITNEETIYLKARLQVRILELKSYCATKDTKDIDYSEDLKWLIMSVALRTASLLSRDIPVDEELAHHCYNMYYSKNYSDFNTDLAHQ